MKTPTSRDDCCWVALSCGYGNEWRLNMRRRSKAMTTVDSIMPLVDRFNGLSDEDKLVFLDLIDPLPDEEETKPTKKRKRRAGKSPRASSLAQQIKTAGLPKPGNEKEPICSTCGNVEDYADHSQPSP